MRVITVCKRENDKMKEGNRQFFFLKKERTLKCLLIVFKLLSVKQFIQFKW